MFNEWKNNYLYYWFSNVTKNKFKALNEALMLKRFTFIDTRENFTGQINSSAG